MATKDEASVFNPLASYLSELGLEPHAVTLAPSDCSVPLETLAQQLADFIDRNFLSYQKIDFVAFSLGGIVARYYIQRMGGLARTNRLLTVAAPPSRHVDGVRKQSSRRLTIAPQ